jgi:integrase
MGTLTNAAVRDAKPRAKVYELTCAGLPGFVLRILPTGKKVFVVRHRMHGQDCRVRLGLWSATFTVEEARRRAAVILGGGELDVPTSAQEYDEDDQPRALTGTPLQRRHVASPSAATPPLTDLPSPRRSASRRAAATPPRPAAPADLLAEPSSSARSSASTRRHAPVTAASVAPPSQSTEVADRGQVIPDTQSWASAHAPARPIFSNLAPARASHPNEPTLRDLADRYRREYIDVYLKPRTASNYRYYLDAYILPKLGDLPFTQVTRSMVQSLHASLRAHPAAGDYVLCVLGSLYTRIIRDWELIDMRNPVSNTKRFGSRRVERFLTPEERHSLETVLQQGVRMRVASRGYIEPMSAWALQLLAHTGLRKDEIISLKWPMIDWQHAVFNLPDTKTGQRSVPVSLQVMALLREIQHHTDNLRTGYVIRSRTGRRLTSLNKTWERIRVLAGIPDVRLHDLRHSFASDALMGGVPLAIIGKILGHRQPTTTQRYAHLSDRVVRDAIEQTSNRITDAAQHAQPATPAPPAFKQLTNAQWAKVAPIVLPGRNQRSQPHLRQTLDGIRWVLHHNAAWQKVPKEYGTGTTCWRWHKRWQDDGTWNALLL